MEAEKMEFSQYVVIVTGSTRGIGYCIAKALVEKGASVVVNGRDEEVVKATVQKLSANGGKVTGLAGSVENPATGKKLVQLAVERFGKVSALINNAGFIRDGLAYKLTEEDFSSVIDVHVKGTFYCTKPFIHQVKSSGSGGHIINLTSDSGLLGNIGQVNYSAAKAAINGITWTLSKELKRDHVIVNGIAPAALTDMTRPYVEKAKKKAFERGEELTEAWQIGTPEQVADFILSLLWSGDMSETGTIFGVNGSKIVRWNPPTSAAYSVKEII